MLINYNKSVRLLFFCLGQEDFIIISEGLGSTADDKRHDAIAQAVRVDFGVSRGCLANNKKSITIIRNCTRYQECASSIVF